MSTILRLLVLLALSLTFPHAWAEDYPTKPLRLVVPFPAGNSSDMVSRIVAQYLGAALQQAVIVDNRAGAGAVIGTDYGAKQAADGYTLVFGATGALAIAPTLQPNLPYKLSDFAPIASLAWVPQVLVVPADSPVKDVASLLKLAKENPGKLFYGSSGNGTTQHLIVANFASVAGVKLTHVPYKGGVAALSDLVGGRIDLAADAVTVLLPHIQSGKLRAIGVTTNTRLPQLPNVPTIEEQGVHFNMRSWMTLMAPAGTPEPILAKLSSEVEKIRAIPAVQAALQSQGLVVMDVPRQKLMEFVRSEQTEWGRLVISTGAKIE